MPPVQPEYLAAKTPKRVPEANERMESPPVKHFNPGNKEIYALENESAQEKNLSILPPGPESVRLRQSGHTDAGSSASGAHNRYPTGENRNGENGPSRSESSGNQYTANVRNNTYNLADPTMLEAMTNGDDD